MIFVPTDNPQMEITLIDTLGGRETSYLYFTDCEAPARTRCSARSTRPGCS